MPNSRFPTPKPEDAAISWVWRLGVGNLELTRALQTNLLARVHRWSSPAGMHLEMGVAAETAHRDERRPLSFPGAQLCAAVFPHAPRRFNHVANGFIGRAR